MRSITVTEMATIVTSSVKLYLVRSNENSGCEDAGQLTVTQSNEHRNIKGVNDKNGPCVVCVGVLFHAVDTHLMRAKLPELA